MLFHFWSNGLNRRYEASPRAVALAGHEAIIGCVKAALGNDTPVGNGICLDWFPAEEGAEQLVVLRYSENQEIVVFLESEREAISQILPGPP